MFADALPALPGLSLAVLAVLTTAFAYLVFGMTGFGAALVAAPVLAHVMPLTSIVPLLALLDCAAALASGLTLGGKIARRELAAILPFLILGNTAGAYLLFLVPPRPLMAALGASVLGYALYSLFTAPARRRIARAWVILFGSLGGIFGSMFGSGGFAFAIYLARRLDDRDAIRASHPKRSDWALHPYPRAGPEESRRTEPA